MLAVPPFWAVTMPAETVGRAAFGGRAQDCRWGDAGAAKGVRNSEAAPPQPAGRPVSIPHTEHSCAARRALARSFVSCYCCWALPSVFAFIKTSTAVISFFRAGSGALRSR